MKNSRFMLWLAERRYKFEIPLAIMGLAAVVLPTSNESLRKVGFVGAFSFLALLYFLSTYFPPKVKEPYGIVGNRVINLSAALSMVGFMFTLLHLPNGVNLLIIELFCLAISTGVVLYQFMRSRNSFYGPFLIRAFVIMGLTVWVLIGVYSQVR